MAYTYGTTGSVVSWAGTGNSALVTSGSAPAAFVLNISAREDDITPLTASGAVFREYTIGLGEWSGSIETRPNPAKYGSGGNLTGSGPYLTNVQSWRLRLDAGPVQKITGFDASGVTHQSYAPSLWNWGGTYTAGVDSSTAIVAPSATAATLTFKLIENASADHTLSGSAMVRQIGIPVRVGNVTIATFEFRGTGALTAAGTSGTGVGNPFFAAGTIGAPATGSLVLQAATNRTYTGDAFPENVEINCVVDELITAKIGFRGTGALTIA